MTFEIIFFRISIELKILSKLGRKFQNKKHWLKHSCEESISLWFIQEQKVSFIMEFINSNLLEENSGFIREDLDVDSGYLLHRGAR